jgi:hypothetical protein
VSGDSGQPLALPRPATALDLSGIAIQALSGPEGFALLKVSDLLPEISTWDYLESSVERTEGSYQDEEDQIHRRTDD